MTSSPSKTCTKCKVDTPLSEFYRSKRAPDGRQWQCKPCCKQASMVWKKANPDKVKVNNTAQTRKAMRKKNRVRDWLISKYQGVPCMDCIRVYPWCAMDFDHRPGEIKEFNIGTQGCQRPTPERLARVEKEIAKCDIVCSNCHRVRTQKRRDEAQRSM